jgi:hypothetical protein
MTTEFWIVPRVAFQLYDSKFMVVGQTLANASAYNSIKARTRNSTSASMGTTLSVDAGTSAFECFSPEIAGDVFPASSSYFVLVWHRRYSTDGDIWYAVYRADGTPHLAATPLAQDVNRNLTRPKISSSTGLGGNSGQLQAAWSNNPLGPPGTGPGAIEVRRIRYDGVLLGSTFTATAVSIPHYSLDVSEVVQATDSMSGSNYYVVTYDTFAPTRSTGLVLCSGDQTHDEIILNDVENSVPTQTDRPVLGATADSWILATARKVGSQNQIWNSIFQPSNGTLSMSEPPFMVYSVAYQSLMNEISVASTVSGGAPATWTGALVVASHDNGAENEIKGAFVYAASDPAVGSQYCVGDPNSTGVGALILASGDNSATTLKELQTVFMPAHQFCYMLSGTMAGFVDNPGGSDGDLCLGGAIGRYNLPGEFGNSGATGTYTFSLDPMRIRTNTGDVTGMVGSTWYFQTWFRDTPAGSGHSNFSNGVALTLD